MDWRGVKRIENDSYCRDDSRKKSVQDQDQYRCGRVGIQKEGGEGGREDRERRGAIDRGREGKKLRRRSSRNACGR